VCAAAPWQFDVNATEHEYGFSAGQIVFNPDGTINYIRGPHEQLSGTRFCPALTP
jgi:hypothetical protein